MRIVEYTVYSRAYNVNHMSQDKVKKLQCTKCKEINYRTTRRIKGENLVKLQLNKFCKRCHAKTEHKEMKK